ncbi:hypothetical protein COO60DRAFT_1547787 [Scenedesmus sp. NREL 46B-D3]|nr:hypothetical protein COO60DRAFT_1547787 [Scenedesmus sp. NREL 46B-D3]
MIPQSPTAAAAGAGVPGPVPVAAQMMPRPMAVPMWMYPQTAGGWGMATYPQHWPGMPTPYYAAAGYYPAAYPGMTQPPAGMQVAAVPANAAGEAHPASASPAAGAAADGDRPADGAAAAAAVGGARPQYGAPYHQGSSRVSHSGAGSEGSGAAGDEAAPARSGSGYLRGGAAGAADGNRALYIGNLAPGVDEHVLTTQFSMYGQVINAQIIRDRETRAHRGYGFVTFSNAASAQAASAHLNGRAVAGPFQGRQLRVAPSTKAR